MVKKYPSKKYPFWVTFEKRRKTPLLWGQSVPKKKAKYEGDTFKSQKVESKWHLLFTFIYIELRSATSCFPDGIV
jgi:hypothetical protein